MRLSVAVRVSNLDANAAWPLSIHPLGDGAREGETIERAMGRIGVWKQFGPCSVNMNKLGRAGDRFGDDSLLT